MTWTVQYTKHASHDLQAIYAYIAHELLEPLTAQQQTDRIMETIRSLSDFPFRHRQYEDEPWHSRGLRVVPVDRYLVFYLPSEPNRTVTIIRIFHGGGDVSARLSDE